MQFWWEKLKKRYNKTNKRILSIIVCFLFMFSGMGIAVQKAFASYNDPKIEVILESAIPNLVKSEQEIEVTYTVKPNDFTHAANTNNTQDKEIVFLIDKSKAMTETNNLRNGLTNDMLNALIKDKNINVHFTTISYNDNVIVDYVDPNAKDNNGVPIDYRNGVQNSISTVLNASNSTNDTRNLGQAINKAIDFFDRNENPNSIKNIIIISEGEPSDQLPNIDKNKYNVITLAISTNTGYDNPYAKLKEWHTALGGSDDSYYISSASENHNDINSNTSVSGTDKGEIIKKMCTKLEGINYKSYSFINAKLTFDLNDNFDYIQNSVSSNIKNCAVEGNKLSFDLSAIHYAATTKNSDGTYVHKASPFTVSFKIKPKTGKIGELGFAPDIEGDSGDNLKNYISYTKLNNTQVKEHIETPIITVEDEKLELRILEIQPANSFTLKGVNNLTETGIDTKTITRGSTSETYDLTIEHVSMPEFIGKIDQLNGKYDVIVIGRNNANIVAPYRDYSAINNNGTEYTGIIKSGNELLPNGNYVENDITKRKAEEIKAFIDSGQLAYINNSILTDVSRLQNSNLYKTFNSITATNFIKYSNTNNSEDISLENILEKYLEKDTNSQNDIINKRPNITVENTSGGDTQTDYSNTTQADYLGSAKKRNMKFLINIPQDTDRFTVKLFLDINGDGVFTDDECYRKATNVSSQSAYSLSYNIGPQFIGWLDWKVEVEKSNGVKSYVVGNTFFKKLKEDDIKQVKVLQVSPSSGLDLQNDTTFKDMLKDFNDKKDYKLIITKITSDEFNGRAGKTEENISTTWEHKGPLKLNGNYNMVVIGFSDSYNKKDITGDALNELQDFIKTGQSVMFTHDTMTMRMESSGQSSVDLTKRFRDFVGQSRFIDKYRSNGNQTDAYQQYNQDTETYGERIIPHSDLINQNGAVLTTNSSIVGYALNGRKNITHTTKVYKTNSGLISNYPFQLGDISVANTHNQWYQLNLEDPDVVPWYNLKYDGTTKSDYSNTSTPSGSKLNQYDSRNNYYTYSKGNITYSGTGHSQGYTTEEFRLFINTMIKAERGANHNPDVVCSILNEYKEDDGGAVNEVPKGADYSFKVDANDLDRDKVYVDIKIDGKALDSSNVAMNNLNNGLFEVNTQNINRSPLIVTIPADKLSTLEDEVTVVIKATDIQGADSETKTYKIRPIEMPKFDINAGIPTLKKIDTSGSITDVSGTIATVKPGHEVMVSYNVTPSVIEYGDIKTLGAKEISVIIDDSLPQSTWAKFKNGLDDTLGELLKTGYMRYNIITFGKDGASVYKENYGVDDLKNNLTRGNLGNNIGKTDYDGKRINSALDLSVNFFNESEFQTDTASKTIMIFSKGNVEAINERVESLIKDNYNVITVQISDDDNSESGNLKNVHNALGALNSDYHICNSGHGRESHDNVDAIMEEISNSISRIEYKAYMLDNVEMHFNLGDEIDLVNGLTQVDINTNEYNKTLPKVKYVVDVDENGDIRTNNGKPIYKGYFIDTEQQDSAYTEVYPVEFKITSAEDAHGLCTFSTPNEVTYKYYGTNSYGSTDITSTPQLQLDDVSVSHGVYKGIKNGQVEYLSGSNVKFIDNSVGTFAAHISNLYKDNTTLSLNIDTNCELVGIPTIYRITEGNNLEKLTDSSGNPLVFTVSDDDKFVFNNFNGSANNDIVVLYSVKFKGFVEPNKEYMYTNTIAADVYSADANVPRKTNSKLPDLF